MKALEDALRNYAFHDCLTTEQQQVADKALEGALLVEDTTVLKASVKELRDLWRRWPKVSAHEMQEACKRADKALTQTHV